MPRFHVRVQIQCVVCNKRALSALPAIRVVFHQVFDVGELGPHFRSACLARFRAARVREPFVTDESELAGKRFTALITRVRVHAVMRRHVHFNAVPVLAPVITHDAFESTTVTVRVGVNQEVSFTAKLQVTFLARVFFAVHSRHVTV